ncbi:hypothetical protein RC1_3060 [Rhodospirillum centenum SW]|uniref:Uncharacterized protein n=1 Tax=Rhodospirillum centenum (strain ATCC 51521 / SW) TaxID=414684 RepID=B6IVV2_RHOCS|nr:hypothetical protein RC1_3060 [Rhodospirillum centenum SW]
MPCPPAPMFHQGCVPSERRVRLDQRRSRRQSNRQREHK